MLEQFHLFLLDKYNKEIENNINNKSNLYKNLNLILSDKIEEINENLGIFYWRINSQEEAKKYFLKFN